VSLTDDVIKALAGRHLSVRELVRHLELGVPQRQELKVVLKRLLGEGRLARVPGGRLALSKGRNLVTGRLQCSPGGFGFVSPIPPVPGEPDIFVPADAQGGALHGDRVVVRLDRKGKKGPEGRVVKILERALTRLVGRYQEEGRWGGRVAPFDRRVLREVSVPKGGAGGARPGDMVVVEIQRHATASHNPSGRVLEVLGGIDEPGVDLKVILAKYELPDAFPEDVEREADAVPQRVEERDLAGRTDFRPWATVTVDPETARDHDDAISLDLLGNGHWLLAVHIADVAHYVPEGSRLDEEAYLRGTSVYFPDRVVPMLPHALSSRICSLVENEDRLTQSVVMELDPEGRVVRTEFHDGVIRSAARMTYEQVQRIVDGDGELRRRFAPQVDLFGRMDALAKVMRKRRHERGSLDFDLPEPKLVLDPLGEMTGVVATERLDSMRVIEEFMLAANEAVAARLQEAGAPTLYRVHEPPDPERVEEFCELVKSFGYRVPPNLEEVRPKDFQQILRRIEGRPEERFVSYLLLRTMKLARYSEENLGHFGLAATTYCHFTSPIRRYPDLVVHRTLRALRHGQKSAVPAERLGEMALHLSEMERRASDAERELIEWKKVRFMAGKLGEVFSGYITGVQSFGMFVELDDVFVQGLVHVSSMGDDFYVFNEGAHTLKGERTRRTFRLGDPVEVQVVRVDLDRRQIDFALPDALAPRGKRARGGTRPPPRRRRD
jgi:ribonuclease R